MRWMIGVLAVVVALGMTGGARGEEFGMPMDRLYENRVVVESGEWLSVDLFNVKVDPKLAWRAFLCSSDRTLPTRFLLPLVDFQKNHDKNCDNQQRMQLRLFTLIL